MKEMEKEIPKGLDPDKLVKLSTIYISTPYEVKMRRRELLDEEVFEDMVREMTRTILRNSEKKVTENPDGSKTYELIIHLYNKNKK